MNYQRVCPGKKNKSFKKINLVACCLLLVACCLLFLTSNQHLATTGIMKNTGIINEK
jgi:hypothetical protein